MLDIKTSAAQRTKKKRSNKNRKRNWRKNIDITDIEKALEDERLELRTGGLVGEKTDDEIFYFDKTAWQKTKTVQAQRRNKRLRVDEVIVPDPSAVKPAAKVRRRIKCRVETVLERKLERKVKFLKNTSAPVSENTLFDLWENESLDLYDKETKKTTVGKYIAFFTGERQVKRPKHLLNDPSDVEGYMFRNTPAVEIAHPGASYNPTYDDHQNLLAKAHLIEVDKVKAQEKINRALHVPYDQLPYLDTHENEMQEGLFDSDGEDVQDFGLDIIQNAPVRAGNRKCRRTRKREEREEMERRIKEETWANKLRENEVFRTKTFLAEIKAKERKDAETRELRKKRTRKMTLSNVKFAEQDIELKLSDEIKGSLRELKPEAGLLTDRYKSFQKRGIVEPRCKRNVPKRKRKVKYQEKRPWREIEG